jgi:hypothetical protein
MRASPAVRIRSSVGPKEVAGVAGGDATEFTTCSVAVIRRTY